MKIFKIAKKVSSMTKEELLSLAMASKKTAIDVATYVFNSSIGTKFFVFNELIQIKELANDKTIKRLYLRLVMDFKEMENSFELFMENVDSGSISREDILMIASIANAHPMSCIPAIIMLSGNSPTDLTNMVASSFGFTRTPSQKDIERKNNLDSQMQISMESGFPWENEHSGIFYGLELLQNKNSPRVNMLIDNAKIIPDSLVAAISRYGTKEMSKKAMQKANDFVIFTDSIAKTEAPNEKMAMILDRITSWSMSPKYKIKILDWALNEPSIEESIRKNIMYYFTSIPNDETFRHALELFRDGKYYNVKALTSNDSYSKYYSAEIEIILKRRNQLYLADDKFLEDIKERDSFSDYGLNISQFDDAETF
jgi:hypothetical protein